MPDNKAYIEKTNWNGNEALKFAAGGYEATILPQSGANVIILDNPQKGVHLLREVTDYNDYLKNPFCYGIPILFPPNRIRDGKFQTAGKLYQFPVNEASHNNHLHGFLSNKSFEIIKAEAFEDKVELILVYEASEKTDFYIYYPHKFIFALRYVLSSEGLSQEVSFLNNGEETMPAGLGFHTSFRIPFCKNSTAGNCRLKMSVDAAWELDERMLPTGEILPLNEWEKDFSADGIKPLDHPFDNHYRGKPFLFQGKNFNGAILEDLLAGVRIVYEADDAYRHWMLYNGLDKRKDFICPEPQTWIVNAPNMDMTSEESGLILLPPMHEWKSKCRIYTCKI